MIISIAAVADAIKVQLAKSTLVSHLLQLFSAADDDDLNSSGGGGGSVEKLGADLVVLLLTGDGSMEQLYGEGQGALYKETVAWLSSPKPHLQAAGALAMGNFARSDIHCIQLVHEGVAEKLLQLLERCQDDGGDDDGSGGTVGGLVGGLGKGATLQHAVLSALRNLAIPGTL